MKSALSFSSDPLLKPNRVKLPSSVAIIAPASPMHQNNMDLALQKLREFQLEPLNCFPHYEGHRYLAGSDESRAQSVQELFSNDSFNAIFCVRGGYGCLRILEHLDFDMIAHTPKPIIGYSDITFLHWALWKRCQLVTFHGPTISQFRMIPRSDIEILIELLTSDRCPSYSFPKAVALKEGKAEGRVLGGNLTCFCHLLGTPFEPDFSDSILLLEDRGEALYRIDRMVTHLRLAGRFENIKGILLGEFTSCGPVEAIWNLFAEQFHHTDIPILAGIPVGHGSRNITIPLGIPAIMDTHKKILKCLEIPTKTF